MPKYRRRVIELATFIALLPIVLIVVVALMATLLGCEVNEAVPQACYFFGADIGGTIMTILNLGWLGLILLPIIMCIVPLWLLFEWMIVRRRRRIEKRAVNT